MKTLSEKEEQDIEFLRKRVKELDLEGRELLDLLIDVYPYLGALEARVMVARVLKEKVQYHFWPEELKGGN